MSNAPKDNKTPIKKKISKFLKGTSVSFPLLASVSTYIKTPALMSAGIPGIIGAGAIGFGSMAFAVLGAGAGLILGGMTSLVITQSLNEKGKKRFGGWALAPILVGTVGGAIAGYTTIHDAMKSDVLDKIPAQYPEKNPTEEQEKPAAIQNLSALSDTANDKFSRDQVLMRTPTHALVLPARHRPSPTV